LPRASRFSSTILQCCLFLIRLAPLDHFRICAELKNYIPETGEREMEISPNLANSLSCRNGSVFSSIPDTHGVSRQRGTAVLITDGVRGGLRNARPEKAEPFRPVFLVLHHTLCANSLIILKKLSVPSLLFRNLNISSKLSERLRATIHQTYQCKGDHGKSEKEKTEKDCETQT
jgi:hypothetical protein